MDFAIADRVMMTIGTHEQKQIYFFPQKFEVIYREDTIEFQRFISRTPFKLNLMFGNTDGKKFNLYESNYLSISDYQQEKKNHCFFQQPKEVTDFVFANIILAFLKHHESFGDIRKKIETKEIYNRSKENMEFFEVPMINMFHINDYYLLNLEKNYNICKICIQLSNKECLIVNNIPKGLPLHELLKCFAKNYSNMQTEIEKILKLECNMTLNEKMGIINFPIKIKDLIEILQQMPVSICEIIHDYLYNDRELKSQFLNTIITDECTELVCNPEFNDDALKRLKFPKWICEKDMIDGQVPFMVSLNGFKREFYYDINQNIRNELFELQEKNSVENLNHIRILEMRFSLQYDEPKWKNLEFDISNDFSIGEICLFNIIGQKYWESFYNFWVFLPTFTNVGVRIDQKNYFFYGVTNFDLESFKKMLFKIPYLKRLDCLQCANEMLEFIKQNASIISDYNGLIDCKIASKQTRKRRFNNDPRVFSFIEEIWE